MAFDFYFAGTQCEEANYLIRDLNANVLKSYVNDKKEILKWFEYKKNGWKGKLLIDNGEFTFHRKGGSLDIDEYIKWLNDNDEYIDYAIALDSIPGKWGTVRTVEDFEASAEKTWNNYLYMLDRVKSPNKLLPVYHMGEHISNLERFLACKDLKYMCISAFKDTTNKFREDWYDKVFDTIDKSGRTDMQFHCLGSATIQNAEKFPFTSMDATSWIMTGANGGILTDVGVVYVGVKTKLTQIEVDTINEMLKPYNITCEDVVNDYKARMVANVHWLYNKSHETKFKSTIKARRKLF